MSVAFGRSEEKDAIYMPSAKVEPMYFKAMGTVHEDELGEAVPITHALFLPMDEVLPRAPFFVAGQSGLPDAVTLTTSSSSMMEQRTVTSDWRTRRSVSRIRFGRKTV